MSKLIRFGVSLDAALLEQFNPFIAKLGYKSRSEAIRERRHLENLIDQNPETYDKDIS